MPTVMWGIGGAAMKSQHAHHAIVRAREPVAPHLSGRTRAAGFFPGSTRRFFDRALDGDTLVIETTTSASGRRRAGRTAASFATERWHLDDPAKFKITGFRPDRPPPKIEGKILVNEMTMNDPQWYADKDYKVTVIYRKLGNYMLEDNCSEGIWMKASK